MIIDLACFSATVGLANHDRSYRWLWVLPPTAFRLALAQEGLVGRRFCGWFLQLVLCLQGNSDILIGFGTQMRLSIPETSRWNLQGWFCILGSLDLVPRGASNLGETLSWEMAIQSQLLMGVIVRAIYDDNYYKYYPTMAGWGQYPTDTLNSKPWYWGARLSQICKRSRAWVLCLGLEPQ